MLQFVVSIIFEAFQMPSMRKPEKKGSKTSAASQSSFPSGQYCKTVEVPKRKGIFERLHTLCQRRAEIKAVVRWNRNQSLSVISLCDSTVMKVSYLIQNEIDRLMSPKPKSIRFSKHINVPLQRQCYYWSQVINNWKHWLKGQSKFNGKFKAIQQDFRKMIKCRRRLPSLDGPTKHTLGQDRREKIVGRRRYRLKQKRAARHRFTSHVEKKGKQRTTRRNIDFSKYAHLFPPKNGQNRPTAVALRRAHHLSKLKLIPNRDIQHPSINAGKRPSSQKPSQAHEIQFSCLSNMDRRNFVERNVVLHYSNQHIFVYRRASHCFRTSKRNLIEVVSTLDTEPAIDLTSN